LFATILTKKAYSCCNDIHSYNKVAELEKLKPEEKKLLINTNKFDHILPAFSVSVLKIPVSVN